MKYKDYHELVRPAGWATSLISVSIGALLASFQIDSTYLLKAVITFIIIGPLLWGGLYTLNSILDIKFDKAHPVKKLRPLPSGTVSKKTAWSVALIHIIAAIGLALILNWKLIPILFAMILLQVIYVVPPFRAKERYISPVFSGPMNHLFRMIAGYLVIKGSLAGIPWLFLVGMVLFYFAQYILYKFIDRRVFKDIDYRVIFQNASPKSAFIRLTGLIVISNILILLSVFGGYVHPNFLLILILTNFDWFATIIPAYFKKLYTSDSYDRFMEVKHRSVKLSLFVLITLLIIVQLLV